MSFLQALVGIFTEPSRTFDALRERLMWWQPLVLLILANVLLFVWYYSVVDIAWLVDAMLDANPDMPPEAAKVASQYMTKPMLMTSTVIGAVVGLVVALLVSAVYYLLADKVLGGGIGFVKWLAFAAWTTVPSLLQVVASALQLLTSSTHQIALESLNPLSLNYLLFHVPAGNPWAGLLNSLSLPMFWCVVVAIIGIRRWLNRGTLTASAVVLLPYAVIYGGWAAFAMLAGVVKG